MCLIRVGAKRCRTDVAYPWSTLLYGVTFESWLKERRNNWILSRISFLVWLSTEAVAFFHSPVLPFFPPCLLLLSRLIHLLKRLSLHGSPNWKIMDLINWSLSAMTSLNEKSGFWGTRLFPTGTFAAGYTRDAWEKWQSVWSGGSFRWGRWGYLPFRHHDNRYSADWIRLYLGYLKIRKTGTAVQSLTRLPVLIEAVGKSGQHWDWDYKPEYGCHHVETHGFASENWWFQRPEWTERISWEGTQLFAPKDTTKFNLIFSGSPYRCFGQGRLDNHPERAMQSRLSCSLPPLQTLLPSPDQLPPNALYRH